MFTYAALAGFLILVGVIVWIALRWMRADAKTSAKESEIIKQTDIDNKVLVAQRDALINKRVDPTKPDDILGGL